MAKFTPRWIAVGCLLLGWVGCSESDDGGATDTGDGHNEDDACGVIATRCHPYAAVPEAAMCHDLGHSGTATVAECEAALESCMEICPELDGGVTYDAGMVEAGTGDAGAADCTAYCECMVPTCGAQIGGDFADQAACEARCSSYGATELSCWSDFCDAAQAGTSPTHNCEHAAGLLELEECP